MGCHDNALDYLHALGYNVVLLPKGDVAPLQLLSSAGRVTFDRFGDLGTVLIGNGTVGLPPVSAGVPAASFAGRSSSQLKLGIGLSVLGNVIAAMGGSPLGLETVYGTAAQVSFEFRDVFEDRVEVAALDRYVAAADVDPFGVHAQHLLTAGDLLVVTSTLKTTTIAVRASDRAERGLTLEVPVVQDVVGAPITVGSIAEDTTVLTYTGPSPLVFGFQAVRLHYVDGFYRALLPTTKVRMRDVTPASPPDGAERVLAPGPLVRLGDG